MTASLIAALQSLPPTAVLAIEVAVCYSSVLLLARAFGKEGLYAWIAVAVILANVQVLKPVEFALYGHPVALGTVVFASTFLATDILAEHFGRAAARKGVMIGFGGFLAWTLLTLVTLGYAPLTAERAGPELAWAVPNHDAMAALFQPQPAIFAASMAAYLTSQMCDVWIFDRIRRATGDRLLWLRNNGSTLVSGLIDNTVFSVLAWVVLADTPVGWEALVFTYILGTYGLRVVLAVADTPFMYLSRTAVARHVPPAAAHA